MSIKQLEIQGRNLQSDTIANPQNEAWHYVFIVRLFLIGASWEVALVLVYVI